MFKFCFIRIVKQSWQIVQLTTCLNYENYLNLFFTVLKLISEFLNEFFQLAIGITFILLPRIETAKTVFMFRYNNIITQLFKCAEFTLVKMCLVFFARRQLHFLLGFILPQFFAMVVTKSIIKCLSQIY